MRVQRDIKENRSVVGAECEVEATSRGGTAKGA